MTRKSMMGLVRKGATKVVGPGFLVTWAIDSRDRVAVNRMQYFLFGRSDRANAEGPERTAFVWREGVRYIAPSAVAVQPDRLPEIQEILRSNGIDHEVYRVSLD